MNMIVNVDKNWGIGLNNKLLVSIPADMKFFRQTTTGNVVVMGRKTLESFPNGLPLKNRRNIVLTRDPEYKVKDAEIVHSREELMELLKDYRARYLGIGKVNPDFKLFYETEPNDEAKAFNEKIKKEQASESC